MLKLLPILLLMTLLFGCSGADQIKKEQSSVAIVFLEDPANQLSESLHTRLIQAVQQQVVQKGYTLLDPQLMIKKGWKIGADGDQQIFQKINTEFRGDLLFHFSIIPERSGSNLIISGRKIDLKDGLVKSQGRITYSAITPEDKMIAQGEALITTLLRKEAQQRIVIELQTDLFLKKSMRRMVRLAFEEVATRHKYVVVDDRVKQIAFGRIQKDRQWKQNDPKFLQELGKQLAANEMVLVEITALDQQGVLLITNRFVNLKTGLVVKTENRKYDARNDQDYTELFDTVQILAERFLCKSCQETQVAHIQLPDLPQKQFDTVKIGLSRALNDSNISISDKPGSDVTLTVRVKVVERNGKQEIVLEMIDRQGKVTKTIQGVMGPQSKLNDLAYGLMRSAFKKQIKSMITPLKLTFIQAPAGTFQMGYGGKGALKQKAGMVKVPTEEQQRVTIKEPFWIASHEVDQKTWNQFMGKNPSAHKACLDCPVEKVSFQEIQHFIKILNENDPNFSYRLPSDLEWEYAARADATTPYHWGKVAEGGDPYTWHRGNSMNQTHPVGQKKANPWGLYDIHGNVYEITSRLHRYNLLNPKNPLQRFASCSIVIRGGAFTGKIVRATKPNFFPGIRNMGYKAVNCMMSSSNQLGFRLVAFEKNKAKK